MENFLRFRFCKSIDICQQLAGKGTKDTVKLSMFLSRKSKLVSNGDKSSDYLRDYQLLHSLCDLGPFDVSSLDLEINRNTKNSNHKKRIKRLTAFVLKDSSGLEKIPTERPGVRHPGSGINRKSNISC